MVCTCELELLALGSCSSVEQLEQQMCSLLSCCMEPSPRQPEALGRSNLSLPGKTQDSSPFVLGRLRLMF